MGSSYSLYRKLIFTPRAFYTFEEIKQEKWNEYEPEWIGAFQFCSAWLNGATTFTLKTSGSTGQPKSIQVTRDQMLISARGTKRFLNLSLGCTLLCNLNTDMIAGKMMLVRAMEWQGKLLLSTPSSQISSPVPDIDIDLGAVVPMQLESSIGNPESLNLLNRIKHLLVGGAPTPPSLRAQIKNLKGSVYQTFGMTETVSHIAMADLKTDGPLVYKTLPGVKIALSPRGTLLIKARMASTPTLETNDLVEIVAKNRFLWKGRIDFVINSGGVKLFPEQLESEIEPFWKKHFPGLLFFIWKTPDQKLGEAVLLVAEKAASEDAKIAAFLMDLKKQLPKYHIPKNILFVQTMHMTDSSKINKVETMKPYLK